MSLDAYLTLLIFALTVIGLIVLQSRPVAVFGGTLITLIGCNLVTKSQLLTSIANPGLDAVGYTIEFLQLKLLLVIIIPLG